MSRIVTLNIRHGGGSRIRRIVQEVALLRPDIFVATEFRNGPTGDILKAGLGEIGLDHQIASPTPERANGVLVAGRVPLSAAELGVLKGEWLQDRHLIVRVGALVIAAVYLPPGPKKIPSWERLIGTAQELVSQPTMLLGDFNTGKHHVDEEGATFIAPEYIDRLEALGYKDAWRSVNPKRREYTWFSANGNGFRLDYAFLAPTLFSALMSARHVHECRLNSVSDHSALLVEFNKSTAL